MVSQRDGHDLTAKQQQLTVVTSFLQTIKTGKILLAQAVPDQSSTLQASPSSDHDSFP